jgi:hypothetical protein
MTDFSYRNEKELIYFILSFLRFSRKGSYYQVFLQR